MKKIMFADKFSLTEAVLSGRKTQTRRIIKLSPLDAQYLYDKQYPIDGRVEAALIDKYSRFRVGEIVAVAQSYMDAGVVSLPEEDDEFGCYTFPAEQTNGWANKMFVRADLMPHQIRITNVRVELLQSISDNDCRAEGIYKDNCKSHFNGYAFDLTQTENGEILAAKWYETPREAYAALIDKISGKGTWKKNPYVFAYDFELVK